MIGAIGADRRDRDGTAILQLLGRRKYRRALDGLGAFLAHDPQNSWAYRLRALTLLRLGRAEEALKDAHAAIRWAPEEHLPLVVEARCLDALGRKPEAAHALRDALELAPTNAEALALLGLRELDLGHPEVAELHLLSALEHYPLQDDAPIGLARLFHRRGDVGNAKLAVDLHRAVLGKPTHYAWTSLRRSTSGALRKTFHAGAAVFLAAVALRFAGVRTAPGVAGLGILVMLPALVSKVMGQRSLDGYHPILAASITRRREQPRRS